MTSRRYYIGYVFSMLLTFISFGAVWLHYYTEHEFPSHPALFVLILIFAIVQLVVQLVYFLDVDNLGKRNTLALCFAATIVIFIVGGTLWIMTNLSNNQSIPYDNSIPSAQNEQD